MINVEEIKEGEHYFLRTRDRHGNPEPIGRWIYARVVASNEAGAIQPATLVDSTGLECGDWLK